MTTHMQRLQLYRAMPYPGGGEHGGAILLRPDGQQVGSWPGLSTLLHNGSLPGHFRRRTVN